MKEQTIINAGNKRYLSEVEGFEHGLPHGVINKTKCDVGATYLAANCDSNYIIVCPFTSLVDSIADDPHNTLEVFKCYAGVKEWEFRSYLKRNAGKPLKIAVTYNSLEKKILKWLDYNTTGWKLLIDEYHTILEDACFRADAIDSMMANVDRFKNYTFLSATPIDCDYEIEFLQNLPHYKIIWDGQQKIKVHRIHVTQMREGLVKLLKHFEKNGFLCKDMIGEDTRVDELFIFCNSVRYIKQICDTMRFDPDDVKICCAEKPNNKLVLKEYKNEPITNPNKKYNFFTKKCFQGCNLKSKNGLIIVASDGERDCTLVDISTTMEQIAGRLRDSNECTNLLKNHIIHLFSTKNHIQTDEEFEIMMKEKEYDANKLISGYGKLTDEEREAFSKRMDVETDIISIIDGKPMKNDLKRKHFIYKHELSKCYQDGITIRAEYRKSDKFITSEENEKEWNEFDVKLAKMVVVRYDDLLKDYLETRDEIYDCEYPEFKKIAKYLTEKEMNSCKWNKETMIKLADDKALMETAFINIYENGKFFTNAELKKRLQEEFNRLGIKITAKATLIKECTLYEVTGTKKNGKAGYLLGKRKLDFTI